MWFWENTVVVVLGRLAFSVYLAQLIPMAYDYTVKYERLAISWPAMVSHLVESVFRINTTLLF